MRNACRVFLFGLMVVALPRVTQAESVQPVLRSSSELYVSAADEFASALVVDATSGKQLYAYKPTTSWSAASLTKLMSAMVFVDHHHPWSKIVTLKSQDEVGGGRLRVASGATMSVDDLWYSSIMASANNTTMTLARLSGLSMKEFVKQMNIKAKKMGLTQSSFVEPTGMDPQNLTTAQDLYTLARAAFSSPKIRSAATRMSYAFQIRNTKVKKNITNTNILLTLDPDMWVAGGKTGYLVESQYNLVVKMRGMSNSPDEPMLYVIVLGAPTKSGSFASAKALAQWAWKAYSWQRS